MFSVAGEMRRGQVKGEVAVVDGAGWRGGVGGVEAEREEAEVEVMEGVGPLVGGAGEEDTLSGLLRTALVPALPPDWHGAPPAPVYDQPLEEANADLHDPGYRLLEANSDLHGPGYRHPISEVEAMLEDLENLPPPPPPPPSPAQPILQGKPRRRKRWCFDPAKIRTVVPEEVDFYNFVQFGMAVTIPKFKDPARKRECPKCDFSVAERRSKDLGRHGTTALLEDHYVAQHHGLRFTCNYNTCPKYYSGYSTRAGVITHMLYNHPEYRGGV